ncbi:MAG: molybdopterin molybdotransferase MoeA, partial [Sulfurimonadaceae bacterium]|nr:molybdopterin molybdotransferase MoeA [Sulfurimonadaceae bacterium]
MAVSVEEALQLIYNNVKPKATELVPIEEAVGRTLAQDVTATHNLPPYDNSAMDGYAVKVADAGRAVEVLKTIFAGDNDESRLFEGSAIKIMTGAKIPDGTECIVPVEDTEPADEGVRLPEGLKAGRHIRLCGEDIQQDDALLTKGQALGAHHITLLASQGISHVMVHQRPRIALFASGSELKMHFENVESYQLYNTNTPTFMARAQELGCEVRFIGTAEDTLEAIKDHIASALDSDLIITSGGVSVGDADYTKEAFDTFGFEKFFDKVNIKPGKPTTFGRIGSTLVLNLPGNPLAAALNFELFAQSIILSLGGSNEKYLGSLQASMPDDFSVKPGRRTLVPGWYDG